ncbi:hypothetical protein AUQ37_08535 [Candidatus Methanomethylophilus sp. 1R26]|uniref:hypothetical protein n=1 Tax=Candidatus Methanomethylophilus sp. 1R26 TaxID=1769296 RepID=UPI000736C12C|nr:hypothetical protein [Candidatus Methanomethylophilus sp. 1R26]KUE73557.1 hypothetical protein AUQ37_08535 [Candidatus Methanomethylophilus sp. 1R26]WII09378.1 hypothetical protein O8W32_00770 [Methanomassiliicoccales archaeon LGM-DZ1]
MVLKCSMDRPGATLELTMCMQNIYAADLYILQDRFGFTFKEACMFLSWDRRESDDEIERKYDMTLEQYNRQRQRLIYRLPRKRYGVFGPYRAPLVDIELEDEHGVPPSLF